MTHPVIDFYGQYLDKFKEETNPPEVDLLFKEHYTDARRIEAKQIEFLEFFRAQFEFLKNNYFTCTTVIQLDTQGPTLKIYREDTASVLFNIFFKVEKVYRLGDVIDKHWYVAPYGYKFLARFITYFNYINLNNELVKYLDEKGATVDRPFDFQEAFLVLKATERIWNPSAFTS